MNFCSLSVDLHMCSIIFPDTSNEKLLDFSNGKYNQVFHVLYALFTKIFISFDEGESIHPLPTFKYTKCIIPANDINIHIRYLILNSYLFILGFFPLLWIVVPREVFATLFTYFPLFMDSRNIFASTLKRSSFLIVQPFLSVTLITMTISER